MRSAATIGLALVLVAGPLVLASAGTVEAQEDEEISFSSTCMQLRCFFEAEGQEILEGNVSSIDWTFGPNGTTATGSPVEHTFPAPGTYDVSLTITAGEGNETTRANATGEVTVSEGEVPWSAVAVGAVALVGSLALARMT